MLSSPHRAAHRLKPIGSSPSAQAQRLKPNGSRPFPLTICSRHLLRDSLSELRATAMVGGGVPGIRAGIQRVLRWRE